MRTHKVFIDGAEGTTGLRIQERLAKRSEIELLLLPEEQRKDVPARLSMIQKADVSLLCLPDSAAKEIVALAPRDAKICDASTAHRTLSSWQYGFPELSKRRSKIASATRVAVPGCHATGFLALCTPLLEQGALSLETALHCFSITGYSGGGKPMIKVYESEEKPSDYNAPRLYGLGLQHKHLPEMQAIANLSAPPLFCPIVDDYYSGMLVSVTLPMQALSHPHNSAQALRSLYAQYYQGEQLISIREADESPSDGTLSASTMAGRDSMEIFVCGSDAQILLSARFDNLGKGASGAAVQCMNLMLGLEETQGLVL